MTLTLGIDGGASATKWALRKEDGSFIEGKSKPIDGHIYRESSRIQLSEVLTEINHSVDSDKVVAIYAGITGIGAESIEETKAIFTTFFPGALVKIVIDMELGYRAHFNLGQGIFLYSGTGSIAVHMTIDNKTIRAGGWGYLLGDEGGGYWIGLQGIRHTVSILDKRSEIDPLSQRIMSTLGVNDWDGIKAFVYSRDRSAIASLAQDVINLALSGDPASKQIVTQASIHLGDLVRDIDSLVETKNLPVVLGGGISEGGQFIRDAISTHVGRAITLSRVNMAKRAAELAVNSAK